MKLMTIEETKKVKAGWTCWFPFCGKKGTNPADGMRHAQLNPFHAPFISI
ncbi:hypothetical protein [Enterococcus sp. S86.2]|nr:hypothetical protein [Enterococcus sp. S86.2]